jgi:hypothetical protein
MTTQRSLFEFRPEVKVETRTDMFNILSQKSKEFDMDISGKKFKVVIGQPNNTTVQLATAYPLAAKRIRKYGDREPIGSIFYSQRLGTFSLYNINKNYADSEAVLNAITIQFRSHLYEQVPEVKAIIKKDMFEFRPEVKARTQMDMFKIFSQKSKEFEMDINGKNFKVTIKQPNTWVMQLATVHPLDKDWIGKYGCNKFIGCILHSPTSGSFSLIDVNKDYTDSDVTLNAILDQIKSYLYGK